MVDRQITSLPTNLTLVGSRLQFVPNYGPEGILIVLGGIVGDVGGKPQDFAVLPIFDPAGKRWYNQTTTGEAPAGRAEHCVSGKPSPNGTYEIFVYGGHRFTFSSSALSFDTIHILTLPSFHW